MTAFGLSAALVAFSTAATAHPPEASGAHHDVATRAWHDARQGVEYQGSLMAVRADGVTLQLDDGAVVSIPMVDLDPDDRTQAESKLTAVRSLNESVFAPPAATATAPKLPNSATPWQAASFAPFAPFVRTHADAQWLYVESDGLPHAPVDFTMMVGIRAWQQQLPIPQAYTGDNAWQIPLRPAFAEIPISGKNGLRRGAIALAANGIPIFNAYNNRGEDSFAIGELDDFGGHCGRADDYHYHAAPLALQKAVGAKNPIAFALDGFAIYGLFDPKAKAGADSACPLGATTALDQWNGHECTVPAGQGIDGGTRSYHYHASKTYPYINGGMRGKVTVSADGEEINPQAHAAPFRPSLPPLRGASITGFKQTGPKAWSLSYQVSGRTSRIDYAIDESGKVKLTFVGPDGKTQEESYSRQARAGGGQGGAGGPGGGQGGGGGKGGGGRRGGQGGGQGGGGPPPSEVRRTAAPSKDGFEVHSAGIGADGMLDKKYTCDGDSISPPIEWTGLPAATKSVAIAMHHIPPGGKEGVDEHAYIVLWGLTPATKALAESQHDLGTWGINTVNRRAEYAPPCSKGPGEKSYMVTVYALSAEPKLAAGRAGFTELLAAMKDTTISIAEVELRYARERGAGDEPPPPRGDGEQGGAGDPPPPPPPPPGDQNGKGGKGGKGGRGQGGGQGGGSGGPGGQARGQGGGGQGGGGGGGQAGERGSLIGRMTAFHTDVPAHASDIVLVRPTDRSITASVAVSTSVDASIEHWRAGDTVKQHSAPVRVEPGHVALIELKDLAPGTEYRYRLITKSGADAAVPGAEHGFRTQAPAGKPFTFTMQADSHLDANMDPKVYTRALQNALADAPDFHMDLGDTFMTDKRRDDFHQTAPQYEAQRWYFGQLCADAPLFMTLGNHDGESGSAGTRPDDMGPWSFTMRTERFPAPAIASATSGANGGMYSGLTTMTDGRGSNYYAFTWGDALVVVLDPFWPTTERAGGGGRGGSGGGGGGGGGGRGGPGGPDGPGGPGQAAAKKLEPTDQSWTRTLGRAQYDWLARTLAASKAKYKFVFIHHLVGGLGGQESRGGVESAPFFEWGGKNADGTPGFAAHRPGWPMPIHDLLVKNGVSAVFHGHDHVYVHSELDGVTYQCVPQPGNALGGTRSAEEYGYASGTILGSPGHVRVRVTPDAATVDFVRASLGDQGSGGRKEKEANGTVIASYAIKPGTAGVSSKKDS